jgi:hypothetical protein
MKIMMVNSFFCLFLNDQLFKVVFFKVTQTIPYSDEKLVKLIKNLPIHGKILLVSKWIYF